MGEKGKERCSVLYALRHYIPSPPLTGILDQVGSFCAIPGSEYTADAMAIERLSLRVENGCVQPAFLAVIGTVVPPKGAAYQRMDARTVASSAFVEQAGWLLQNGYPSLTPEAFFSQGGICNPEVPLTEADAYAVTQSVLWRLLNSLGEMYLDYYRCDSLGALHTKSPYLREAALYWYHQARQQKAFPPPALSAKYSVCKTQAGLEIGPFTLHMQDHLVEALNVSLIPFGTHYFVDKHGCQLDALLPEEAFYLRLPITYRGSATLYFSGHALKPGLAAMEYVPNPSREKAALAAPAQLWIQAQERSAWEIALPLNIALPC